jgi:hypothetical protein
VHFVCAAHAIARKHAIRAQLAWAISLVAPTFSATAEAAFSRFFLSLRKCADEYKLPRHFFAPQ